MNNLICSVHFFVVSLGTDASIGTDGDIGTDGSIGTDDPTAHLIYVYYTVPPVIVIIALAGISSICGLTVWKVWQLRSAGMAQGSP